MAVLNFDGVLGRWVGSSMPTLDSVVDKSRGALSSNGTPMLGSWHFTIAGQGSIIVRCASLSAVYNVWNMAPPRSATPEFVNSSKAILDFWPGTGLFHPMAIFGRSSLRLGTDFNPSGRPSSYQGSLAIETFGNQ